MPDREGQRLTPQPQDAQTWPAADEAGAADQATAAPRRNDYAIPLELWAPPVTQEEIVIEPVLDDGPYELGVVGFVSGREGDHWVLTECIHIDDEWVLGDTFLVDVRHPYAARLFEGRVASVRGLDGGTASGEPGTTRGRLHHRVSLLSFLVRCPVGCMGLLVSTYPPQSKNIVMSAHVAKSLSGISKLSTVLNWSGPW